MDFFFACKLRFRISFRISISRIFFHLFKFEFFFFFERDVHQHRRNQHKPKHFSALKLSFRMNRLDLGVVRIQKRARDRSHGGNGAAEIWRADLRQVPLPISDAFASDRRSDGLEENEATVRVGGGIAVGILDAVVSVDFALEVATIKADGNGDIVFSAATRSFAIRRRRGRNVEKIQDLYSGFNQNWGKHKRKKKGPFCFYLIKLKKKKKKKQFFLKKLTHLPFF